MLNTRILAASTAALLTFAGAAHAAQAPYPSKVIRIITSAHGSNNDWASRLVGDAMAPELGQRFIVENRGGLAVDVVAKAPPDGYTLLFYGPAAWTQHLFRETQVDPLRDLAPITMAMSSPIILVVHPSLPVKSVKDLIALAKARPGELNYASGTIGATPFLAGELFKYMAGVNIERIAYKGTGPSMIGVMAGEAQVMWPGAGSAWTHVQNGKLRALGVASNKPSALAPGLQPISLTVPGYESTSQMAFQAPANTPKAIIDRLHKEIVKAVHKPEVKALLFKAGVESDGSTPQELRDYIVMDIARIEKMMKATGFSTKAKASK